MPIAAIFLHYFYNAVSYLRGGGVGIVPWPHFCKPFTEMRDRFKEKTFFSEITMFLERKIDKIGADLKL